MKVPVALVTGASRGAGKGIALALGKSGYCVYVTGRTAKDGDNPLPGSVWQTVGEINRNGSGVGVICDHSSPEQIETLFQKIQLEQGRLDILVNNATVIHDDLIASGSFWEKSIDMVEILDVGLKSAYLASYHAAPIMTRQQRGLIVNTSSFGARCYMHGPCYGAQKAGIDKMTWDMAHDLRPFNVAAISLWMGMLLTERTQRVIQAEPEKYTGFQEMAELPEFQGFIIDALYKDPELLQLSGNAHISAELGERYQIKNTAGKQPVSHRAMLGGPIEWSAAVVE